MEVNEKIRTFLEKYIKRVSVSDEDDIFSLGLVDSLFAMQLVMFIEKEFNIKLDNADLDLENFRSINAITNLINIKLS